MALDAVTQELIRLALAEDIGSGDITTESINGHNLSAKAVFIAKQSCVICGMEVVEAVFKAVSPAVNVSVLTPDGTRVNPGSILAELEGPLATLLSAERTALNFLQRLSGVATKTTDFVQAISGTKCKILDTRKTTPGYRALEKYAVRCGGAENHRIGLYDQVLVKNNHIDAVPGGITEVIRRVRARIPDSVKIEIEVRNVTELRDALAVGPDVILLDNMTPVEVREAVTLVRELAGNKRILCEASGGINLTNVRDYALTGVDFVSVGSLTHSAQAVDISMRIKL